MINNTASIIRPGSLVPIPTYLTFSCNDGEFTLGVTDPENKYYEGILEYSTDLQNWTEWDRQNIQSVNSKIYLRGSGNTKFAENSIDFFIANSTTSKNTNFIITPINTDARISCIGNIETLLDYKLVGQYKHPPMGILAFCLLFNHCEYLVQAPELPAKTLTPQCYTYMFKHCTNLEVAPRLPAKNLINTCYRGMFNSCTSLKAIPRISVIDMKALCCNLMFSGCTSIKLSETQEGEYQIPYEISAETFVATSTTVMFNNTGGTFAGKPEINTVYYLSTDNSIVE